MKKSKKEQKRFWTNFWMQFWGYFHICRCIILFVAAVGSFIWLFIDSKQDLGTTSAIILGVIPFGILLWRSIVALIKGKDSFDDCRRERESEIREEELKKQVAEHYRNRKKMGLTNSRRTISKPIRQSDPSEDEPDYSIQKHEEDYECFINKNEEDERQLYNEVKKKINQGASSVSVNYGKIKKVHLDDILRIAANKQVRITFYNIESVNEQTLLNYSKMLKGNIVIDRMFKASFVVVKLVETGASLTIDCSDYSTLIKTIAEKARGKGHVTFINYGTGYVPSIKKLLEIGGDNIEFK